MWSTGNRNGPWHYGGDWYGRISRRLGVPTLKAARHTFQTAMRDAGVPETINAELVGHTPGTTMGYSRYAKPGHLANLQEAINKLPANPGRK